MDSSGFITIHFPDSVQLAIENHLSIFEILRQDICSKSAWIVSGLERTNSKSVHTVKNRLNDSIYMYGTYCYTFTDSVRLVTKVNWKQKKVIEATILDFSGEQRLRAKPIPYGNITGTYYYGTDGMIDSAAFKYLFTKNEIKYQECLSIKCSAYDETLLSNHEFTKLESSLFYRLYGKKKKFKDVIREGIE